LKSEFSITAHLAMRKRMTLAPWEIEMAKTLWAHDHDTASIAMHLSDAAREDIHEAAVAKAVCAKGIGVAK
jgi:hypothetical protein